MPGWLKKVKSVEGIVRTLIIAGALILHWIAMLGPYHYVTGPLNALDGSIVIWSLLGMLFEEA